MTHHSGGAKIIIKDADGTDEVLSKVDEHQIMSIFKMRKSIEVVSHSSLCSLILKITIPEDASISIRSDVFDETGELLNASNYMHANNGKILKQCILKCFVIQEDDAPRIKYKINDTSKIGVFSKEMREEFDTQAHIYSSTMAYGGSPVCPDVSGLTTMPYDDFKTLFHDLPDFILQALNKIPESFRIGIILMEAIPDIYENLGTLYDNMQKGDDVNEADTGTIEKFGTNVRKPMNNLFIEFSKQCLAILIIIVYRAGIFPLDAHLNNWMYITEEHWNAFPPAVQARLKLFRLKSFDFDLTFRRNDHASLQEMKTMTDDFFALFSPIQTRQFATLMDVNYPELIPTDQAGTILVDKINSLNHLITANQGVDILLQHNYTSYQHIHTILVLGALLDMIRNTNENMVYNRLPYAKAGNSVAMRFLYRALFGRHFYKLSNMLSNVNINLHKYNKSLTPAERAHNILIYQSIQSCIHEYTHTETRGVFPHTPEPILAGPDPWRLWTSKGGSRKKCKQRNQRKSRKTKSRRKSYLKRCKWGSQCNK